MRWLLANERKNLLIVEKTGWGKSVVYFIATRLLRKQGKGPTLIVCPLIVLMENQIASAAKIGLYAAAIHSDNTTQWGSIEQDFVAGKIDVLLIAPEKLDDDFVIKNLFEPIYFAFGLLVVDEAHCISDWGHDFRPDYRRIAVARHKMPEDMPVLATTATANDRVVTDIEEQLGVLKTIRGSLFRESLVLQNIQLASPAKRLAWLEENIPQLPGSGIVYTLTTHDAEQVALYLQQSGIKAKAYHARIDGGADIKKAAYKRQLEEELYNNKLKVLVATIALGMGYDKPDLGFVIHYQSPASLITYYQQVGRAGRGIDKAYGILFSGQEDNAIHSYFIDNSYPSQESIQAVLEKLGQQPLSMGELLRRVNYNRNHLKQILKYLASERPAAIIKEDDQWKVQNKQYRMDEEKNKFYTQQKTEEWYDVQKYIKHIGCLMNYLQQTLNDKPVGPCGKCAICVGKPLFVLEPTRENEKKAISFLKNTTLILPLPKKINNDDFTRYKWNSDLIKLAPENCVVLSKWGYESGHWVMEDKRNGLFRNDLVNELVLKLESLYPLNKFPFSWITCAPSVKHPSLLREFTEKIAKKLNKPFRMVFEQVCTAGEQKKQRNQYFQCRNIDGVFSVNRNSMIPEEPVLLIDDVINSGWTMTVLSLLLIKAGCRQVFPVALSSRRR